MNEATPNLAHLFCQRFADPDPRSAVRFYRDNVIQDRTWGQLSDDVYRAAAGLQQLGIQPGDRVAQLSENRYEWIVADLAIQACQAIHVPIHAPLAAAQVEYQVQHSGAAVLFVSGSEQQAKLSQAASSLPSDLRVIAYESWANPVAARSVYPWQEWLASQDAAVGRTLAEQARDQLQPDSLATILYTSGTTGQPKGVMLSQRNLVSNAQDTVAEFEMRTDEIRMCFLPLSHIFARTCDLYTWIAQGYELALATSRESVVADCQWIRPTILSGVPYFFDRLHRILQDHGAADQPGALRELLGGRIRYCFSGGAALPDHTHDFFQAHGIPLLQGYGLTETSPVISISTLKSVRRGAAGVPLRNVEVAVAEDGELITRGPHVMQGYWRDPQSTAEVLRDGWFHTGDLGYVDEDGFIYITGRKKELIVTAAGKNVAPVLLESLLTADPLIEQALVIGDDRNYLSALLVPNWHAVRAQIPGLPQNESLDATLGRPEVQQRFAEIVSERLSCVSYHEQVRRFTLLNRAFSLELHEITPKLSLRRPVINEHFKEQIEAMYRPVAELDSMASDDSIER